MTNDLCSKILFRH